MEKEQIIDRFTEAEGAGIQRGIIIMHHQGLDFHLFSVGMYECTLYRHSSVLQTSHQWVGK